MTVTHRHIDVDHIWELLGPWGKYQWKQISSYLFVCVSWVIHQLTLVFIGYRPEFNCKAGPNASLVANTSTDRVEYKDCSIETYRNTSDGIQMTSTECLYGWDYAIPPEQSFVTEWNFVCGQSELAELTQTLMIVGMMIGNFIFPPLADKWGRKPIMVLCHIILFVSVMLTSFSPNYYIFVILRVITGASSQGALSGTILALETFPAEFRHKSEVLALSVWTTAICLMSPIAFLFRNVSWRYLQAAYAMLSAWSIFQWWMLDESLRWVIANGQVERAKKILKNACKWNKKDYDTVLKESGLADITTHGQLTSRAEIDIGETDENADYKTNGVHEKGGLLGNGNGEYVKGTADDSVAAEQDGLLTNGHENPAIDGDVYVNGAGVDGAKSANLKLDVKTYTVLDIFKNRQILKVSLIIWYTWIVDSVVYYGLYMISSDLYGDRYLNFFLSALIEYPAAIFEYFALARLGRKWSCVLCHLVAALGLTIATVLTYTADGNTSMLAAGTAFTLIGKMGATGAFSTVYVITAELYPTNLRNTGLGAGSNMGKVGGMIAPFSRNVSHVARWLPGAIYALLCVITIFLFAFVPETCGVELPQTMEELSQWYKVNTFELKIGKNRHVANKDTKTSNSDQTELTVTAFRRS